MAFAQVHRRLANAIVVVFVVVVVRALPSSSGRHLAETRSFGLLCCRSFCPIRTRPKIFHTAQKVSCAKMGPRTLAHSRAQSQGASQTDSFRAIERASSIRIHIAAVRVSVDVRA